MAITAIDALVDPVTIAVDVRGPAGVAATVTIGEVTDVAHDAESSVANVGTPTHAVLDFELRQGIPGEAATITVGTVTTGAAGSSATVTNVGDERDAVFDFTIPRGDQGVAATIGVGTVTTLEPGNPATVANVGDTNEAIFNFGIPKGDKGLVPRGEWDPYEETYVKDDAVTHEGQLWLATEDVPVGEEPGNESTSGTYWTLYVAAGGVTGPVSSTDGHAVLFDGVGGNKIKSAGGPLAAVALSGAYGDLSGAPALAPVATSGDYDDLTNKPTLGTAAAANTGDFAAASHSHTAAQISDASADGRSLITAANYAAMRTAMGVATAAQGSLADTALQPGDAASGSDIRSFSGSGHVTGAGLASAIEAIAPSGAANWTPDWSAFAVADWNVTANRTLSNPTNVIAGATRYVFIRGSSGTPRTITFGSNYKGNLPTLNDVTSSKWYLLSLVAYSATHIVVAAVEASP